MKSNATVTAADSSNEARQPSRFEKKRNMILPALPQSAGAQHDLDHPFSLSRNFLHIVGASSRLGVCDDEARIYIAGLDSLQQRLSAGPHVRLPGLDRHTFVSR